MRPFLKAAGIVAGVVLCALLYRHVYAPTTSSHPSGPNGVLGALYEPGGGGAFPGSASPRVLKEEAKLMTEISKKLVASGRLNDFEQHDVRCGWTASEGQRLITCTLSATGTAPISASGAP